MHFKFFITILIALSTFAVEPQATKIQQKMSGPLVLKARKVEKALYLPVLINDKGPFWFSVDSGAHHGIIDPFVVQRAGLKIIGQGVVHGTGSGDVPAQHVAPITMKIGSIVVPIPEAQVVDLSRVPIPKWVHGLVGAEFFEKYVVEMDFERSQFRVFDPGDFSPPAGAASIPLIVENHRLYINAKIDVSADETVTHRLRVDTGSEDAVNDEIVKRGSNVRETKLGNGLGADFIGYSGMYKTVRLGPFTFENVFGPGAPGPAIGMEMFRRFTVTFDCPDGKLYLLPNGHVNDPFPPPAL
jgi:hypothetical protein